MTSTPSCRTRRKTLSTHLAIPPRAAGCQDGRLRPASRGAWTAAPSGAWAVGEAGASQALAAAWGSGAGDAWVAGFTGAILRRRP